MFFLARNGKCAIDILRKPGKISDFSTTSDIKDAAVSVIDECVDKKTPSQGGLVGDVGESCKEPSTCSYLAGVQSSLPYSVLLHENHKILILNLLPQV